MFWKKYALACIGIVVSTWLGLAGCGGGSHPIGIAVTAASSTIDGSADSSHQNTTTLTATVSNDKNAAGVSWTTSAGTLTGSTTSSTTLVAPAPTSSAQTITVTATSIADSTKTGSATVTIPAAPAVTSLTGTQQAVSVGTAYSTTLVASGGISPYKWALAAGSGSLPPCLSLATGGVLSAASTPTAACTGVFSNIKFTVTDSGTPNALTATSSAQTITVTGPTIAFPASLGGGSVGSAYSASAAAAGVLGTATYSMASGALPASGDLKLNAATGVISGTPKAADAGTYTFKIGVVDQYGDTATSGTLSITIAAAPAITFAAPPAATATFNVAYSSAVAATGGVGTLTYALATGSLPPSFTLASNGAITGTPKAADIGTWTCTVTASDAYGDAATSASYSIVASYAQVNVTTGSPLTSGYGNSLYSLALAASGGNGGPYTWMVTSGSASLAALNLSLSSGGVLSGTPPLAGGAASFTVQAADSASNKGSATLALTINPGLSITTTSPIKPGYGNTAYSQTFAASGGTSSGLQWSVTSGASTLAALNLSLSSAGVLSGTPPLAGGSASFGVTVTDSASNTASGTYALTVNPGVTVTAPTLAEAYPGAAYSSPAFTAAGGNGAPYTWTMAAASGSSIPSGFSIGSGTGILSAASPVNSGNSKLNYNVVITATDGLGNTGTANATITIEATVTITTGATLAPGTVNVNYSQTLAASGGSGGYTWQLTAGSASLAAVGLSFNTTTGVVSGATPSSGTASFTVTATDSASHVSAPATFSVAINSQLKINQTSLPPGNVNAAYSQTLTASGGSGSGYTYAETTSNLSGYGLSLAGNGTISGTPTQTGNVSFTAKVTDSASATATQNLSIQIYSTLVLPAANSLPAGYVNVAYNGSIPGSGGSGNLTMAITSPLAPSNGTLAAVVSGSAVNITGTPTTNATSPAESITVKLTDTTTNNFIAQTYTFNVTTPNPVTLPAAGALAAGTVSQPYSATITATGGVGPFTWSINGTSVGAGLGVGDNLTATASGNVLTISGTPNTNGTVTLTNVKVQDSLSTSDTKTYSIAINSSGSQVKGQIAVMNTCNLNNYTPPNFTVTINTSPQQQVQTTGGNFVFTGIPNGSYTITPSISGPASVFYPASYSITVNNADVTGKNFQVSLGYTISGTVSYGGSKTGEIYIALSGGCGGGGSNPGTAISAKGAYAIHGVNPGNYTLNAWMDPLTEGQTNATDPSGSANTTVTAADVTNLGISLSDPSVSVPSSGPQLQGALPEGTGVLIGYKPDQDNNGNETVTSYTLQWSTSSSFNSVTGSLTMPANGSGGANMWIVNSGTAGMTGSFSDGTAYYFRAQGVLGSNQTAWTYYGGFGANCTSSTCATTVTGGQLTSASACQTIIGKTCSSVQGAVTIPSGTPVNGPLYIGIYTGTGAFATRIASGNVTTGSGSPNTFTIYAPNGSGYFLFAFIDQNNNGVIEEGDTGNVLSHDRTNGSVINVTGNLTGQNLSLLGGNSVANVWADYYSNTCQGCSGTQTGYNLNLQVSSMTKRVVSATLNSGPNLLNPVTMSLCTDCGNKRVQYGASIGSTPTVGDQYSLTVTYSDGNTDTLTPQVTGVLGNSQLATNLAPSGNTSSLTPTLSWTYPANPGTYTYAMYLWQNNCSGGCNDIWDIPGNGSVLNNFNYSDIPSGQLTWGVDPTNSSNTPSGSLSSSNSYSWGITTYDSNGNSAQSQVWFQP